MKNAVQLLAELYMKMLRPACRHSTFTQQITGNVDPTRNPCGAGNEEILVSACGDGAVKMWVRIRVYG